MTKRKILIGLILGAGILAMAIKSIAPAPQDLFFAYNKGVKDGSLVRGIANDGNKLFIAGNIDGDQAIFEKDASGNFIKKGNAGFGPISTINKLLIPTTNKMYVATNNGAYVSIDDGDNFTNLNVNGGTITSIFDIMQDKSNNLWLSGNDGLYQKVGDAGVSKVTSVTDGSYSVVEDKEGNIWTGASKLWEKKNSDTTFSEVSTGLPDTNLAISKIIFDNSGNLWLGTQSTLYEKKSGETIFNKVLTNRIINIFEDQEKNIWICGENNLLEKPVNENDFQNITSGLPLGIRPSTLFEDNLENLWLGTLNNHGLYESNANLFYSYGKDSQNTTYSDGSISWNVSNKDITLNARDTKIEEVRINDTIENQGVFVLTGNNYAANSQGEYTINIKMQGGETTIFNFMVKKAIVDLAFTTVDTNILDKYTGYLHRDKKQQVNVLHVYDNDPEKLVILQFTLNNEFLLDNANTYYQKIDTESLDPTGNKLSLDGVSQIKDTGLYLMHVQDKVGNVAEYYIQIGGTNRIIADTFSQNLEWWGILLITLAVIGATGTLGYLGYRYAYPHLKNQPSSSKVVNKKPEFHIQDSLKTITNKTKEFLSKKSSKKSKK